MRLSTFRMGSLYRNEVMRILGKVPEDGVVLDVGCYDGLFLRQINCKQKVGIDLHPVRVNPEIDYVQADGRVLPFQKETFDFVYALDVIEHIDRDLDFIQSLVRILAPGGILVLSTPSEDIRLFPNFLTKWISHKWGHYLRLGYSEESLGKLFNNQNVKIKITPMKAQSYRTWYLIARFIQTLAPEVARAWVIRMARLDMVDLVGPHGFLLLEAQKLLIR